MLAPLDSTLWNYRSKIVMSNFSLINKLRALVHSACSCSKSKNLYSLGLSSFVGVEVVWKRFIESLKWKRLYEFNSEKRWEELSLLELSSFFGFVDNEKRGFRWRFDWNWLVVRKRLQQLLSFLLKISVSLAPLKTWT